MDGTSNPMDLFFAAVEEVSVTAPSDQCACAGLGSLPGANSVRRVQPASARRCDRGLHAHRRSHNNSLRVIRAHAAGGTGVRALRRTSTKGVNNDLAKVSREIIGYLRSVLAAARGGQ